ncbi:type II secretion system F family protein [Oceanibacterium hippocampi]|uniref:Type II secretion system protein F n=1 Tax=Oceanibacterium hippocampi TaxID=745714 RepID=A0A1Y5T9M4_9PROT|nr:type II secretion system F family protein [Oceanibacterium hippocampi]SLN57141.1 Type II secretion system protein F [Oceanibacterium hippocampi]
MARFRYKSVLPDGAVSEGEMEAPDRDAVVARLQAANQVPIRADEIGPGPAPMATRRGWRGWLALSGRSRPPVTFMRQLATLLGAGLSLDRALGMIAETGGRDPDAALSRRLLDRIRQGQSFSRALAFEPGAALPAIAATVRAGEASGTLTLVLERLARELEMARRIRQQINSALTYPAILLTVAALSIVLLLTFVIPEFEALFAGAAAELPAATRIVIGTARFMREWSWALGLGVVVAWIAGRIALGRPGMQARFDRMLMQAPLIGPVTARIVTERMARTLALLVGNGVALPEAIGTAADAVGNGAVSALLRRVETRVREGAMLAPSLDEDHLLPALAVRLIAVGEQSGRLAEMLEKVAEIYEEESALAVRRLMGVLEPVLILVLGMIVAAIIYAVLSAVLGLNQLAL